MWSRLPTIWTLARRWIDVNIDTDKLVEILTGVLNAPARSPALQPLARVTYPGRELYPHAVAGGGVVSM